MLNTSLLILLELFSISWDKNNVWFAGKYHVDLFSSLEYRNCGKVYQKEKIDSIFTLLLIRECHHFDNISTIQNHATTAQQCIKFIEYIHKQAQELDFERNKCGATRI